jgi:hypothetical protein
VYLCELTINSCNSFWGLSDCKIKLFSSKPFGYKTSMVFICYCFSSWEIRLAGTSVLLVVPIAKYTVLIPACFNKGACCSVKSLWPNVEITLVKPLIHQLKASIAFYSKWAVRYLQSLHNWKTDIIRIKVVLLLLNTVNSSKSYWC